jgi:hypothetical protein
MKQKRYSNNVQPSSATAALVIPATPPKRRLTLIQAGGKRGALRYPVHIYNADALRLYNEWPRPTVIVSDGAYGLGSFPGDPVTPEGLKEWYEPHVQAWSRHATGQTTLWFWNSELGWATVHSLLVENGWEFRNCHIWNKGKAHVAGNANTKTLRKFPVVTEVCVQYVKKVKLPSGPMWLDLKDWLRAEWKRTGLPFSLTNQACGVINAATRKYFTKCHLWYWPPSAHFQKLADYANRHGDPSGRPYFSQDGVKPMTADEWELTRSKFICEYGVSNVWTERPNRGSERVKGSNNQCIHANQKPLKLLDLIIRSSSDAGDVVWEPFGGLCSVAVSCAQNRRSCYSAEVIPEFYDGALKRLDGLNADSDAARA